MGKKKGGVTGIKFISPSAPGDLGLCAHGHRVVNLFHLVGGFHIHLQCRRPRFNPWVGKIPWRRNATHSCIFLPGESYGQRSLKSNSPWGCKESDTTEWLSTFTSTKQLGSFHQILLSRYFRGELKQRIWGRPVWGIPQRVLLCFRVSL